MSMVIKLSFSAKVGRKRRPTTGKRKYRVRGVSKVHSDLFSSNVSLFLQPTSLKIRYIIFCLFFIRSLKLLVTRMPAFIFNDIF